MSEGKIPTQDFQQRNVLDGTEILFSQNTAHSPKEQKFSLQQVADWINGNLPAPLAAIKTVSQTYVLQDSDETILLDASLKNITVRFPNAAQKKGKQYRMVCIFTNPNTSAELSSGGGQFTDGVSSQSNVFLAAAPRNHLYQSDGINWVLVGKG